MRLKRKRGAQCLALLQRPFHRFNRLPKCKCFQMPVDHVMNGGDRGGVLYFARQAQPRVGCGHMGRAHFKRRPAIFSIARNLNFMPEVFA